MKTGELWEAVDKLHTVLCYVVDTTEIRMGLGEASMGVVGALLADVYNHLENAKDE